MSGLDLDLIEATARAAFERNGPDWTAYCLDDVEGDLWGYRVEGTAPTGNPRAYTDCRELWDDEGALGMFGETAAHVATMDPATTLALVAEVRRLRAQVERVEGFQRGLVVLGNLPIEQREDGLTASVEACAALASDLRVTLDGPMGDNMGDTGVR